MASVKNVKKDIDYLVSEVVSDCYTYLYLHGDKNRDKVISIIDDVVNRRNEFIQRANKPEKGLDKKQVRKHYKELYSDLLKNIDESFTKLSDLSK